MQWVIAVCVFAKMIVSDPVVIKILSTRNSDGF
jgi:hypothetical protein